jgi:hypothetical protein
MGEEDILVGTVVTLFEASARGDLSGVILRGLLERLCVQVGWPNCTLRRSILLLDETQSRCDARSRLRPAPFDLGRSSLATGRESPFACQSFYRAGSGHR